MMLIVEQPAGERIDRLIGVPMEIGRFLQLAIALSSALSRLRRGSRTALALCVCGTPSPLRFMMNFLYEYNNDSEAEQGTIRDTNVGSSEKNRKRSTLDQRSHGRTTIG
jgi:hypothetical protein